LDRKKVIVICVAVGAVALIVVAAVIFGGIFANRPQPYEPATQPPAAFRSGSPLRTPS